MASAICFSILLRSGHRGLPSVPGIIQQQLRHKHQVRVIVTQDLPEGHMRGIYAGEVHNVAAGYARNYLIPKKMAVYATPRNFERCGLIDPDIVAKEEAAQQKLVSATEGDEDNADLKAADLLRRYLRNKSVKIIRHVDPNQPLMCHPGHVTAMNLREKLSKQLKIDLEEHETIHIRNEPVVALEEKGEAELMQLINEMGTVNVPVKKEVSAGENETAAATDVEGEGGTKVNDAVAATSTEEKAKDCDNKIKQLGDYVAKITLAGGHVVPLKFNVGRR
jgi:ribosomal protein L9